MAETARCVRVDHDRTSAYIGTLPVDLPAPGPDPDAHLTTGTREELAAFWLTLDAINFGSGWFPTLRKRDGRSGYYTVATGVRDRFAAEGPWTADELATIDAHEIANTLGQDPDHELMRLFTSSLNDLGRTRSGRPRRAVRRRPGRRRKLGGRAGRGPGDVGLVRGHLALRRARGAVPQARADRGRRPGTLRASLPSETWTG